MLEIKDFEYLVRIAPLFALDFVIINEKEQLLVGQRKNAPAKGYWFVPGGRVFKNESQEDAIKRISKSEIGYELRLNELSLLGIYDHFYDDSFHDNNISTHYINATHAIRVEQRFLSLPSEQHSKYRWVTINEISVDSSIHYYSKIFLKELKQWTNYD